MRNAPAAAGLRGIFRRRSSATGLRGVFRRRSSAAGLRGCGVLPRSQKNARSAKPHPPRLLSHPHFVPFLRMERHFSPSHPQFAPFLRMELLPGSARSRRLFTDCWRLFDDFGNYV